FLLTRPAKPARKLRPGPPHADFVVLAARQRTLYRLRDLFLKTRRLIQYPQHGIAVKALHVLGLRGRAHGRKPSLFKPIEENLGLRPPEIRRNLGLLEPLRNLRPQNVL